VWRANRCRTASRPLCTESNSESNPDGVIGASATVARRQGGSVRRLCLAPREAVDYPSHAALAKDMQADGLSQMACEGAAVAVTHLE